MYWVRGADQNEYGPIDAVTLRRWVLERRLNAASPIRADQSAEWSTLGALPEFAGLKAAAPSRPMAPPPLISPAHLAPGNPSSVSALAITSLVLSLLGLCSLGITAIAGLILGIIALVKIRRSQGRLRGKGLAIAGVCVAVIFIAASAVFLAFLIPQVIRAQESAQQATPPGIHRNACVNNLRQIDGAKAQWVTAKGKQPADVPTWDDLVGPDKYLPVQPKCPDGGTYTIGAGMELPSCSVPDHSMKQNYRYRGNR
jgi:hypothetical protein